jgi:hypothetical protein
MTNRENVRISGALFHAVQVTAGVGVDVVVVVVVLLVVVTVVLLPPFFTTPWLILLTEEDVEEDDHVETLVNGGANGVGGAAPCVGWKSCMASSTLHVP